MKELLLRAQAATKLRTSIVALTQSEFETYCTQLIKKNYPRLGNYCIEALKYLQYKSNILPDYFDPYEWWWWFFFDYIFEVCNRYYTFQKDR